MGLFSRRPKLRLAGDCPYCSNNFSFGYMSELIKCAWCYEWMHPENVNNVQEVYE